MSHTRQYTVTPTLLAKASKPLGGGTTPANEIRSQMPDPDIVCRPAAATERTELGLADMVRHAGRATMPLDQTANESRRRHGSARQHSITEASCLTRTHSRRIGSPAPPTSRE